MSLVSPFALLDLHSANAALHRLREQAADALRSEGIPTARIRLEPSLAVRYLGQFSELAVPLDAERLSAESLAAAGERFHLRHNARNGYEDRGQELELVSLSVLAVGEVDKPAIPDCGDGGTYQPRSVRTRKVYWERRRLDVPVWDDEALRPGAEVDGPALIDLVTSTIVIPPGFSARVDRYGSVLLHRKDDDLIGILKRLAGAQ